ncbi:hypothetical protein [Stenotrophomonas sp. PS02289]|uniref:hypothetical protein n=1 Tax=Stenotrophomonas sp. PS02289 TaxID=2991422 RepID=UPI00249CA266|nr:hypothetical protein [Stenotrophomonas sp. PS02289]
MLKHLLWLSLGLAAVPAQAEERLEDPIAWSCFSCSEEERQAFALRKGEGSHLVYTGFNYGLLYAYRVEARGDELVVEKRYPIAWLARQFDEMILHYRQSSGDFYDEWGTFDLFPPGWPSDPKDTILWGHHVSSLHPQHADARATVKRVLNNGTRYSHFKGDYYGRVIRFDFQLDGSVPYTVRLKSGTTDLGYMEFYFDHDTRSWEYLGSQDLRHPIQETPEDFLGADGGARSFHYVTTFQGAAPYFLQRAKWAGAKVHGEMPNPRKNVRFDCSRMDGELNCFVIHL